MPLIVNDRYELQRLHATGGMGRVYTVFDRRDRRLNRPLIALKSLTSSDGDPAILSHLHNEFRTLSDLSHPNLVQVFDFGIVRHVVGDFDDDPTAEPPPIGAPFFTREFVEGVSLVEGAPQLSAEELLRLLLELTGTFAYLHRQEILHCDLKPDNLLVTSSSPGQTSRLKLLDFGLAHTFGSTRRPVGNLRYLAPELVHGQPMTPEAERYAMGLVFYEVLSGRYPFEGSNPIELAKARAMLQPPPLPASIAADVQEITLGLLDRDPSRRPGLRQVGEVLEHRLLQYGQPRTLWRVQGKARLTGRDEECQILGRRIQDVLSARQAVSVSRQGVLMVGPPGIGKSRLVRWLKQLGQFNDFYVLSAECQSGREAFFATRSLLEPLLRERQYLFGAEHDHLRTLITYKTFDGGLLKTQAVAPNVALLRFVDDARAILERLAREQPLLLILEDLHWADPETRAFFTHLLQHLPLRAGLVVGTGWPGLETLAAVRPSNLKPESDSDQVCLLELQGLRADAQQLFVNRTIGEEARRELDRLISTDAFYTAESGEPLSLSSIKLERRSTGHSGENPRPLPAPVRTEETRMPESPGSYLLQLERMSKGNPLYLEEYLRLLAGNDGLDKAQVPRRIPSKIADVLQEQLRIVHPSTLLVLKALAVWQQSASLDTLSSLSGLSREHVGDALKEAMALQLVEEVGLTLTYRFWHTLLEQSILQLLSASENREMHSRAGRILEASGDINTPGRLAILVSHFTLAGEHRQALGYAITGAKLAEQHNFHRQALELFREARHIIENSYALEQDQHTLVEIGEHCARLLFQLGELSEADDEARRLLDDPAVAHNAGVRVRVQTLLGRIAMRRGKHQESTEHFEAALRSCQNPAATGEVRTRLAELLVQAGKYAEAETACREALQDIEPLPPSAARASLMGTLHRELGRTAQLRSDFPTALREYLEARSHFSTASDRLGVATANNYIAQIHHYQQKYGLALASLRDARAIQQDIGDLEGLADTLERMALSSWALAETPERTEGGNRNAAVSFAEQSLELWRKLGIPRGEGKASSTLGLIHHSLGHYSEALRHYRAAVRTLKEAGFRDGLIVATLNLALFLLEIGQVEQAEAEGSRARELAIQSGSAVRIARCDFLMGAIYNSRADTVKARKFLEDALGFLQRIEYQEYQSNVYCYLAETNLLERRLDEAIRCADRAVEVAAPLDFRPLLAQARLMRARVALEEPSTNFRQVVTDLDWVESIVQRIQNLDMQWQLYEIRGRIAIRMSRPREAVRYLARSMDVIHQCYQHMPEEYRQVYVSDPRRQAVRQLLHQVVASLNTDTRPTTR